MTPEQLTPTVNDMISRAAAIAILEDEMPGHYLSKKTQIVAKLRALTAYEVEVRELEWVDFEGRGAKAQAWNAANYMIQKWSDGRYEISASYPGYSNSIAGIDRYYPSIEAAKAAAQSDHAARIRSALTATPAADVARLVDWMRAHDDRLGQVQGFGYGTDGLLLTVRDCCLKGNQTVWQKQSSAESQRADHADMIRQIDIYRMSLAFAALARIISGTQSANSGTYPADFTR